MKTIYTLENTIQPYAWGSVDGIPAFTGIANADGKPMAEMWMGAHPGAPSRIVSGISGGPLDLDAFIGTDPEGILGKRTVGLFGKKLPFLFKVLSAAAPLSLQVHPTKTQAESGFARDNAAGIPLSSPERNYRDDNHKPEIIMALTPFTAMCGFRTAAETASLFAALDVAELGPAVSALETTGKYDSFCKLLLDFSPERSRAIIGAILEKIRNRDLTAGKGVRAGAFGLLRELALHYPEDIGILAPLYLNVIDLHPGEALYLRAGIMHAYVRGTGLELMASSDNVLRGGLTPKHIDIPELLSVLDPSPYLPDITVPDNSKGMYRYRSDATDFELSRISCAETEVVAAADFPAILIGASGNLEITAASGEKALIGKGKALFLAATGDKLTFAGTGICYMASLPAPEKTDAC